MTNPQLLDYIQKSLASGSSEEQVRSALSQQGWGNNEVNQAFAEINSKQNPAAFKPTISNKNLIVKILIGLAGLLILGGMGYLAFIYKIPQSNQETQKQSNKPKIAFYKKVGDEEHIFYDGKDLGQVYQFIISGDDYAFVDSKMHVIYNGKDLGQGGRISLSGKNFVFMNPAGHIIYNGKDMGEGGSDLVVEDNNIAFCKKTKNENAQPEIPAGNGLSGIISESALLTNYVIYNGKNLGQGCPKEDGNNIRLSKNNIAYLTGSYSEPIVIFNGKNLGAGEGIKLSGENIAFQRKVIKDGGTYFHAIYNGNDMGEMRIYMSLSGNNFAFERTAADYSSDIIYNGEDIGKGFGPVISGKHLAYFKVISGIESSGDAIYHVIYDGKDMGEGDQSSLQLSGDDIAFRRKINGVTQLIYNGEDLGEGDGVVLSD